MSPELREKILDILARHNNMTIATVRPDGYPQATTVAFVSDGLTIYFGCGAQSQKAHNLARDPRISAAIDKDHEYWLEIEGLSLAGTATRLADPAEMAKVEELFRAKFPQLTVFGNADPFDMVLYRVTPNVISVLDYSKGFGHTDLVAFDQAEAA